MSFDDAKSHEPYPPRPWLVAAAVAVLSGIVACLALVLLTYVWHLLALPSDMRQARLVTHLYPRTVMTMGFYVHDVAPVLAGLVLLVLFGRAVPRLARGSSSARTTSIVRATLLAVGCTAWPGSGA